MQLRQSVYHVASSLSQRSMQISFQRGSSSRCKFSLPSTQLPIQRIEPVTCVQVLFRVVAQVPVCLPELPICSLRVACCDTRLSRRVDSFFCASFLLDVRWRLKKVFVVSLIQSTQRVQCASGVGSSRNASILVFAFSKARSNACRNSTRLSPFCKQSAIACSSCCRRFPSLRL